MASAQPGAVERELREARIEIARLRVLAARADERLRETELLLAAEKAQNNRYIAQIVALRNTLSWKITLPIRTLRRGHLLITRR
ncbi:hypothetical protein B0I08_103104 [Glaciihabitans tibetensis]|uniref:Uncharacterized protein n=1 Tax=Glaciihabitans tibetensis TaxID=1266600 RepID=A0A2T0VFC0_9MICO|nr:hypothetical protein [Glaciihabitans tibetensis]PRY68899.1 hypothetical protein B0I08_103104 [Glaciihabitans tibetensis]